MARLLLILLIAGLTPGCFVFDELEKGEAIMEAHRPKNLSDEPKRAAPQPKEEPGWFASVSERALKWWNTESEGSKPERDPSDVVVRCEVGDRTQYTRKSDCLLRGGRIL